MYSFSEVIVKDEIKFRNFVDSVDWNLYQPKVRIFTSTSQESKVYLLIRWLSSEAFSNFDRSDPKSVLYKLQTYFHSDLFIHLTKLRKLVEIYDYTEGKFYKLSKSVVKDHEDFLLEYKKKYDVNALRLQKCGSVRVFANCDNPTIMTFFSSWNSIDDIQKWRSSQTYQKVVEEGSGTLYYPDEYGILIMINDVD